MVPGGGGGGGSPGTGQSKMLDTFEVFQNGPEEIGEAMVWQLGPSCLTQSCRSPPPPPSSLWASISSRAEVRLLSHNTLPLHPATMILSRAWSTPWATQQGQAEWRRAPPRSGNPTSQFVLKENHRPLGGRMTSVCKPGHCELLLTVCRKVTCSACLWHPRTWRDTWGTWGDEER